MLLCLLTPLRLSTCAVCFGECAPCSSACWCPVLRFSARSPSDVFINHARDQELCCVLCCVYGALLRARSCPRHALCSTHTSAITHACATTFPSCGRVLITPNSVRKHTAAGAGENADEVVARVSCSAAWHKGNLWVAVEVAVRASSSPADDWYAPAIIAHCLYTSDSARHIDYCVLLQKYNKADNNPYCRFNQSSHGHGIRSLLRSLPLTPRHMSKSPRSRPTQRVGAQEIARFQQLLCDVLWRSDARCGAVSRSRQHSHLAVLPSVHRWASNGARRTFFEPHRCVS